METARPQMLTVSQLNTYIKSVFDQDYRLRNILVTGEISNFTEARSGHLYMTLKDDKSALKAVMFRGSAVRLKFRPENGMKVIAFGSVSIYEAGGQYQMYLSDLQPDGLGSLNLAFEQLKEKLANEGLFDPARKKPLPVYPKRIGVVTSPTAAAFQDICNVLRRRWPMAEVVLSPTLVQGADAPAQIASALKLLDRAGVDVIIAARGGGSMEDLWAFNDEAVARTVAACETPIVSGVGHETDFTIIDFVSDLRAPTPSAAAELCTPDWFEESDRVLAFGNHMRSLLQNRLNGERTRLQNLETSNVLRSFDSLVNEKRLKIDQLTERMGRYVAEQTRREGMRLDRAAIRLDHAMTDRVNAERSRLSKAAAKMEAFDPFAVLARGYSIAETDEGKLVKTVGDVRKNDKLIVRVSDGTIHAVVESTESK
ncbi:MAG: exodeoxyribonuclease VII large subunit [Ruminococcaceae bacterium]|nr:exodeoxyribonuclease VII large subunit [Oscillospiraceae bacterium]